MRAVLLHRPYELEVLDRRTPEPAAGEVLVRVTHTGVCGTDLKIYTGAMPARCPLIMGHEIAGDVAAGVPGLSAGSRVLVNPVISCGACAECRDGLTNLCASSVVVGREADGGFAEYVAVPRTHVHRLPDSVTSRDAPLIQVLTTCLHAQRRAHVAPGQAVAVVGLGVSGQLHVQLAKARGASLVIGVTRSAWKRSLAEQLGADVTAASGPDAIAAAKDANSGRGPDVVIECTGHVDAIAQAIHLVRPGGTVLLFGICTATSGDLPFYQLYYKEPVLVNARAALEDDFPESIALVARGAIRLAPLITQEMPVWQLHDALRLLEDDVDGRMKIILKH